MKLISALVLTLACFKASATETQNCDLDGVISSEIRWESINNGMKSASFDLLVSRVLGAENSGDLWCQEKVRLNSSNQGVITVTVNNPSGNVDKVSNGKGAKVRWTMVDAGEIRFAGFKVLAVSP
ncbi:MAG: hypothetical protein AB8B96_00420 [Lysobacterales bacterium]